MHVLCVIPARIGSSRLPEKPLQPIGGQPLIRLVAERALSFGCLDRVVVATDDTRVVAAVRGLAVDSVLTSRAPTCGTERVAEVAGRPEYRSVPYLVNIQGDEPFISETAVRGALDRVRRGDPLGTAAAPLAGQWSVGAGEGWTLRDRNVTKVVLDGAGTARSFFRNATGGMGETGPVFRHIGVYAYGRDALLRWAATPPTAEELAESLEQLRPMSYGERIGVAVVTEDVVPGIDTRKDLHVAECFLNRRPEQVMS